MTLSINIPIHFTTLRVSELTKDELISELYDYWLAGVELTECTTDLPKNIIDLNKFNAAWINAVDIANIGNNDTTEEEVKEALEQCISDEWDVLNEVCNEHGEECATAHLEFSEDTGSGLDYAIEGYEGVYANDREFTDQLADAIYSKEIIDCGYFDWDGYCSDTMLDYVEINGYYFRNH